MFDFTGSIRKLLFGLWQFLAWILDMIWEVILKIATLDIYEKGNVSLWFTAIMTLFSLFVIYRLVRIMIRYYFSEDFMERFDPLRQLPLILATSVAISFAPIGYKTINSFTIEFISNIGYFMPNNVTSKGSTPKISTVLIESGKIKVGESNINKGISKDKNNSTMINYLEPDFDINDKSGGISTFHWFGDYTYFPTWGSLFFLLLITFFAIKQFVGLAISIAQRMFLIVLEYLFAPYCIASILEPQQNVFGKWSELIIADTIMNAVQIYATYFILAALNGSIVNGFGNSILAYFVKFALMIGGFAAIEAAPRHLSNLIGGSGSATGNESMSSLKNMASGAVALGATTAGATMGATNIISGSVGGGLAGAANGIMAGQNKRSAILGGIGGGLSGAVSGFTSGVKSIGKNAKQNGHKNAGINFAKTALSNAPGISTGINYVQSKFDNVKSAIGNKFGIGFNPTTNPIIKAQEEMNNIKTKLDPTKSPVTERQLSYMDALNIPTRDDLSMAQANDLIRHKLDSAGIFPELNDQPFESLKDPNNFN